MNLQSTTEELLEEVLYSPLFYIIILKAVHDFFLHLS